MSNPVNVLIVEDVGIIALELEQVIEDAFAGVKIIKASNLKCALAHAPAADIIVTDMDYPDLTGSNHPSAGLALLQSDAARGKHCLAMTGSKSAQVAEYCISNNIPLLDKPLNTEKLISILKEFMTNSVVSKRPPNPSGPTSGSHNQCG